MAALTDYDAYIAKASKKYGVPANLIKQVIKVESGGKADAASGTGPVGLMQISKALSKQYGYSHEDRLDPEKNIDMGARYLAENLKAFGGDTQKALLGYNQGTGGARQMLAGKIPMAEEGRKYMTNKNFSSWMTPEQTAEATNQRTANPMGTLASKQTKDQFNPNYLSRQGAETAPTQAGALASQAAPTQEDLSEPVQSGYSEDSMGDVNGTEKKKTNWVQGFQTFADLMSSIQPPREEQPQFGGGGSALGSRPGGFNFDPSRFENKLFRNAYDQLYYKPNFKV